jgi:hypothetical protein
MHQMVMTVTAMGSICNEEEDVENDSRLEVLEIALGGRSTGDYQ